MTCISDPGYDCQSPTVHLTNFSYDGSGQLTGVSRKRTPASGPVATIAWGLAYASGKVTTVTDPIGGATDPVTSSGFVYGSGTTTVNILKDASNPVVPIHNSSTYVFDQHGRVTSETDPEGWLTNSVFDENGNVTSASRQVSESTWATTTATYDAAGNVTSQTDPVGSVTAYTYRTIDPGSILTSDLLTQTDAWGNAIAQETVYVYYPTGHLCRKVQNPTTEDPSTIPCTGDLGGNADENVDTQYAYDTDTGQLLTETDAGGTVTRYGYDGSGNQTTVTRNYVSGHADDTQSVTTTYAFDPNTVAGNIGLATSKSEPITTDPAHPRSAITTCTYDVLGNLLTRNEPGDDSTPGRQTSYVYDEFGNTLSETQYADLGYRVVHHHDRLRRPLTVDDRDDGNRDGNHANTYGLRHRGRRMVGHQRRPDDRDQDIRRPRTAHERMELGRRPDHPPLRWPRRRDVHHRARIRHSDGYDQFELHSGCRAR